MPVEMKDVLSSNVESVGYDADTSELLVRWKSGKTSAYSGVDAQQADRAQKAWSVTDFINAEIKPRHGHRYV